MLLAIIVMAAAPAPGAERHQGLAYARGTDRLLYSETHWRHERDGVARRMVLYRCPDGSAFARKQVDESPSAMAPDFDFIDGRDGYREGVRTRAGVREVYLQERADRPIRAMPLPARPGAVIDAGFDALVRSRWQALAGQRALTVPFLLPSRQGFLDIRVAGVAGGVATGEPVRRLRMTLDRWYGFVAPATELTYAISDRWLLEFSGIGTIRDAAGRHQEVRIEFPDRAVAGVPVRQVDEAAALPLAGRCSAAG